MSTVDIREITDFTWEWVANFNTHMAKGWTHGEQKAPGFSSEALDALAIVIAQDIAQARDPILCMRAYTHHFNVINKVTANLYLPKSYLIEKNGTFVYEHDLMFSCLKTEVDLYMSRHDKIEQAIMQSAIQPKVKKTGP